MSDQPDDAPRVRVLQRIESHQRGSVVTADPGIFDALFLCDMLGHTIYMQAYADGRLVMIHEGER